MAEVTRVPLPPVSSRALPMLFLGILIGLAIAAAIAWFSMPKGLSVDEVVAGTGDSPGETDLVFVEYVGKLPDGTVFDESPEAEAPPEQVAHLIPTGVPLEVAGVVPGFRDALMQMQRGGSYVVTIPADQGYGASPPPGSSIPANSDIIFDVTLHDFMNMQQVQERTAQIQAVMAQTLPEGADAPAAAQ